MYTTINDAEFSQALRDRNAIAVKEFVKEAIKNNPSFKPDNTGYCEAYRAILRIKEEFPELIESYRHMADECSEGEATYLTYDNFIDKCFYFGENFCPERYNELKKLGKHLDETGNFTLPQEQTRPQRARLPLLLILGGVLIVLAVLAVTLLRQ